MVIKDKATNTSPPDQNEEKVWFEWVAPERAFKRRDREFWVTGVAMLALVSVILFFAKEFLFIVALFSILFMMYALSTVPPRDTRYQITNRGVRMEEVFYPWNSLQNFWFGKVSDDTAIFFDTLISFPKQISLIIHPADQDKIKQVVIKRIPLVAEQARFIDKTAKWLSDRIPLEKNPTSTK